MLFSRMDLRSRLTCWWQHIVTLGKSLFGPDAGRLWTAWRIARTSQIWRSYDSSNTNVRHGRCFLGAVHFDAGMLEHLRRNKDILSAWMAFRPASELATTRQHTWCERQLRLIEELDSLCTAASDHTIYIVDVYTDSGSRIDRHLQRLDVFVDLSEERVLYEQNVAWATSAVPFWRTAPDPDTGLPLAFESSFERLFLTSGPMEYGDCMGLLDLVALGVGAMSNEGRVVLDDLLSRFLEAEPRWDGVAQRGRPEGLTFEQLAGHAIEAASFLKRSIAQP